MALLKVLLLLLGLLGVSVNSGVSLQKRIIGGQNCDNTERLYHVRLEMSNGTHKIRCGGSLISPQWILTAAHCWKLEPGWTMVAVLKVHPRTAVQQRQVIEHNPEIYTHVGQQHDIMMLKLQTQVSDVPLARLPDCRRRLKAGYYVQLAGEGATTTRSNMWRVIGAPIPPYLQCIEVNVHQASDILPERGHLFSAGAPNKDICHGDDGGAAIHNGMIYGVISIGGRYACESSAAIMDVCEYKSWIKHLLP